MKKEQENMQVDCFKAPLFINPSGSISDPKYANVLPAFTECHSCDGAIDFNTNMGDVFWMEARVSQNCHILELQIQSYESNFYHCTQCIDEIIHNNMQVSQKLLSLMPNRSPYSSYFNGTVFGPFSEICHKCNHEIGIDEKFVITGAGYGPILFDYEQKKAVFNISKHVPLLTFCNGCGTDMYGDNLKRILKW